MEVVSGMGSLNWNLITRDIQPMKKDQQIEDWYWENADYTQTLKHYDKLEDEIRESGGDAADHSGGENDNYFGPLGNG